MEHFAEFMGNYFVYIWITLAILLFSILYIRGKKALQMFSDLDMNKVVYSEKSASGHMVRTVQTRRAGASKMLQIVITDQELILKTNIIFAHIAMENDLLHRIPFQNIIALETKKGFLSSKLYVRFRELNGEEKVVLLQTKNSERIKGILEQYVTALHASNAAN